MRDEGKKELLDYSVMCGVCVCGGGVGGCVRVCVCVCSEQKCKFAY